MKRLILAAVAAIFALAPACASAAITSVLAGHTISGNPIPCPAQSDGVREGHGADGGGGSGDRRLKTFDGVALEAYVILPPVPGSGTDATYPLIVQSHGGGAYGKVPTDRPYCAP